MKTYVLLLIALSALFVIGCGTTQVTLRNYGEIATLNIDKEESVTGELVALTDSTLFISTPKLREIPFTKISTINVRLDASREWMGNVLIFDAVPSVIGVAVGNVWMSANGSGSDANIYRTAAIPAVVTTALTALLFNSSEPQTTFSPPFDAESMSILRHYFRHPFKLSQSYMSSLRESARKEK